MTWNDLINNMVNGVFVGIGTSFGVWLMTRHFLKRLEKLEEKTRKKDKEAI
jgi:predicted RND superfamily exporter protein